MSIVRNREDLERRLKNILDELASISYSSAYSHSHDPLLKDVMPDLWSCDLSTQIYKWVELIEKDKQNKKQ